MRRNRRDPAGKFFQDWTQLRFMALGQRPQKHSAGNAEKYPPELPRRFQAGGTKWHNLEAGAFQALGCLMDSRARLSSDRRATIIFKIANADAFQFFGRNFSESHGRGPR